MPRYWPSTPSAAPPCYPQLRTGRRFDPPDDGTLITMPTPSGELPSDVRDLLLRNHGVLLAADARGARISDSKLRRLTAAGKLRRLAQGVYVEAAAFDALDDWQRLHCTRGPSGSGARTPS